MCGLLLDDRIDDHMLTTLYGPNPAQSDRCKNMTVWLDKDPTSITYRVRTPAFYPNDHIFVHEELSDSCETELVRTLKVPPESTSTAGFWELNADDQVLSLISSHVSHVDKDPLVVEMQSVCSKPVEFVDEPPTLENILDDCRMKFALSKYDRKWEELTKSEEFNYLHKYTKILKMVINIDERVHLIGNHGNTMWNEGGVDTCIPWHPNMPCPFNTYSKDGQARRITSCRMPKNIHEDKLLS